MILTEKLPYEFWVFNRWTFPDKMPPGRPKVSDCYSESEGCFIAAGLGILSMKLATFLYSSSCY